jgi:hypothetical protein
MFSLNADAWQALAQLAGMIVAIRVVTWLKPWRYLGSFLRSGRG